MPELPLGVIVGLREDPEEPIRKVRDLGLPTCQISCWRTELFTKEVAERLGEAAERYGVRVTTIWTGYPGPAVWNLVDGPSTIGLVPKKWRKERLEALKRGSEFARRLGVGSITTHVGFIPEDPKDEDYVTLIPVLREIAEYCGERGQYFCFETGQETPVALLRTMEDVGTENLGVNLDPANLLMYGKANPIDALDIIGRFVRGVHAKDGEYPTDGRSLGKEKPLGEGRVNFPVLIPKLKSLGYTGPITVEREISGEQQVRDIFRAKEILEPLCRG